jgi:mannose-1-phosphate guanylyltransferase
MLHAVILAGGSGTRFWPLSRRDRPKQLLALTGSRTLLQQSHDRTRGAVDPERMWIVTNQTLADAVRKQLPDVPDGNILVEPEPRDTAVAIGLAARLIQRNDPEAVLVVSPSDHVIRPAGKFREAVREASEHVRSVPGSIVTFGIQPRSPKTGYGYIRRGAALERKGSRVPAHAVQAFEEKPDLETAQRYLSGGEHLWNSGIFVWKASTVLGQLEAHLPATHQAIERICEAWGSDAQRDTLAREYGALERISIDYAVLEKAEKIVVLSADFEWSDVGSWGAIPDLFAPDEQGNTVRGATFSGLDAKNCLVHGEEGRLITLVGVEDLVVIQTRDAVLVCPRDRAEEVKALVAQLSDEGHQDYL